MLAWDQVKTMVSRAHTTLDSHPANMRRATQVFPTFHKVHPPQLMGLLVIFLPYDTWSPTYFLGYTMAANHGILEEDGGF